MRAELCRALLAEALGTAFLLMAVAGSGIMGERLAGGNTAIALLGNSLATGAALAVLIAIFAPVSGAHFNPAVTLAAVVRREIGPGAGLLYMLVQIGSAILGILAAHLMFALPLYEVSARLRQGAGQTFSEFVATFGLVLVIAGGARSRPALLPALVGLYIMAAYWFTASTSFANPAVTLARALTDTFSGISPASVPVFVAAQLAGALAALVVARLVFKSRTAGENQPGF